MRFIFPHQNVCLNGEVLGHHCSCCVQRVYVQAWRQRSPSEERGRNAAGRVNAEARGTDQDLLSGFMLALDLFAQVSLGDLQVLSHVPAVLEQGQVAFLDPDQLGRRERWRHTHTHTHSAIPVCKHSTIQNGLNPTGLIATGMISFLIVNLKINSALMDMVSCERWVQTFTGTYDYNLRMFPWNCLCSVFTSAIAVLRAESLSPCWWNV